MFHSVDLDSGARFNSASSSDLIDIYERFAAEEIRSKGAEVSSRTFAPSSFRCQRKNWFRLRGTEPDYLQSPDLVLDFQAQLGSHIHTIIQRRLMSALGPDWIDVEEYVKQHCKFNYTAVRSGYEVLITISEPPVRFACDGIIRMHNKLYLLEIKSSDYKSWEGMSFIKPIHMDQIQCYSAIIGLRDILTLYVDRQHGTLKSYETHIPECDIICVHQKIAETQEMAKNHLAPNRLNTNDYMCKNCEYRIKCAQWG